jgi:hypothetical protein
LAARFSRAGSDEAQWPLRFSWNRLPGMPPDTSFPVRRRRLLALEGEEVRGAVSFFEHQLWLAGSEEPIAFVWPDGMISEGVVNGPTWRSRRPCYARRSRYNRDKWPSRRSAPKRRFPDC